MPGEGYGSNGEGSEKGDSNPEEKLEPDDDSSTPDNYSIKIPPQVNVEYLYVGGGPIPSGNSDSTEPLFDGSEDMKDPLEISDFTYGVDIKPKDNNNAESNESSDEISESSDIQEIVLEFTSYENEEEINADIEESDEVDETEEKEEINEFDIYYDHVSNAYDIPIYIDIAPNIESDESDYTEEIEQIDEEQISVDLTENPDSSGQISFLEQSLISDQDSIDEIQQDEQQELSFDVVFDPYLEGVIYPDELMDILDLVEEPISEQVSELEKYIEFKEPIVEQELVTEPEAITETRIDMESVQETVEESILELDSEVISEVSEVDKLLNTEIEILEIQEQQLEEASQFDTTEMTEELIDEVNVLESDVLSEEKEIIETQETELSETEIIYEKEKDERINRIYSDGTLEREESTDRIITTLPRNLALWVEMNKRNRIKVKTDFDFISEDKKIEKVKNVEIEIYRTNNGIIIILPYNEKGNRIRSLIKKEGRLKSSVFGLLNEIDNENSCDSFEERLKILLEFIQPQLGESERYEMKLNEINETKVQLERKGQQIHIKRTTKEVSSRKRDDRFVIYEDLQEKRGSLIRVFLDSTITFTTKKRFSTFWVPKRLSDWKKLPARNKEYIIVKVKLSALDKEKTNLKSIEMKAKVYATKNKIKLKPLFDEDFEKIKSFENETLFQIEIPGKINNITQIPDTKKFIQIKFFFSKSDLLRVENSKLIAIYEQMGLHFRILMNEKGTIYIHQKGRLRSTGSFRLSEALSRYIENFDQSELVIASLNNSKPIVIKSKARYNKNGQFVKNIHFPIKQKQSTEAEVLITSPNWELKKEFLIELRLLKNLQKKGINIDFLTSNIVEEGLHKDPKFESRLKKLLKIASNNLSYKKVLPEIEIWTSSLSSKKLSREKIKIDLLVIPDFETDNENLIKIIEIKSSEGQSKYKHTKKGIHRIKHLQRRLGKENVLAVVVINADKKNSQYTASYGLLNGVLLIGKEMLKKLERNPQKLNSLFQTMHLRILELESNFDISIHPIYGYPVSINELHNEAYQVLLEIHAKTQKKDSSINKGLYKYSQLMNISFRIIKNIVSKFLNKSKKEINDLHQQLCNNKIAVLRHTLQKDDKDLVTALKNKELIQRYIPKRIKLLRKKYSNDMGTNFEKQIKNELEENVLDVISNLILSNGILRFEIDHLILNLKGIIPVSCKDYNDRTDIVDLTNSVRTDIYEIEHITEMLNAEHGIIYVKVQENFKQQLKRKIKKWTNKNITVIIK